MRISDWSSDVCSSDLNVTLVVKQGDITVGGNTTVNMGGNKVTNIAKGEAGTDAVNVDQLTDLADKPLTFTADSGADLDRKLGEKVGINGADSNISTETTRSEEHNSELQSLMPNSYAVF